MRRIGCLQHAHAADGFGDLRIDIAAQRACMRDGRRAPALVQPHDHEHARHQHRNNQHQAPVEPCHRNQRAGQQNRVVEHYEQHLHIQRLHCLGVIGHAADQLTGDRLVKKCHRQPQHMTVHRFAQASHRPHRQTR